MAFTKRLSEILRDFVLDGVPSSGVLNPFKIDFRKWGAAVEAACLANPNVGLTWSWDTGTTDADPGAGKMRANNASPGSATFLYISETGFNGEALAALLASMDDSTSVNKGILILRDLADLANSAVYEVVAGFVDGGGYVKMAVVPRNVTGAFAASAQIGMTFHRAGDTVHTGLDYAFDTGTSDANPGSGKLRLNNASPASATFMYISKTGRNGENLGAHIGTWDDGSSTHKGHGRVFDVNDRSKFIEFDLNTTLTDAAYWKVPLANVAGSVSAPAADAVLAVEFVRAGDANSISGAMGAADNRVPRTDGGTGNVLQQSALSIDDAGNASGLNSLDAVSLLQNGVKMWSPIVKAADETRVSTTTLAADTDLKVSMLANTKYHIRGHIFFETPAAGGFKLRFTGPASPSYVRNRYLAIASNGSAGAFVMQLMQAYSAADIVISDGVLTGGFVEFDAIIYNGANAGDFQIQWAQNTSNGGNTSMKAGSYFEARVI